MFAASFDLIKITFFEKDFAIFRFFIDFKCVTVFVIVVTF